jgi:hypothetical protein
VFHGLNSSLSGAAIASPITSRASAELAEWLETGEITGKSGTTETPPPAGSVLFVKVERVERREVGSSLLWSAAEDT